ncbi:GntR family transcriptional regulator [Streptomyces echinatus]|uniref:GntR family transcriptional regulator n=1 Tax=Streptomyces echinatus TaxID=67293 RepID=UPI0037AD1DD8
MAQPEYMRIAAELRRRITSGEFGPGEQIPTLPALAQHYEVSETTIRNALALLRNEGLIETRARAGTRVRQTPPVHRMAADRYRSKPGAPSTPFTRDQGIGWSEYRLDKKFERVEATAGLASLFECEVGERLLARHFVFFDNDTPTQMSTSYVRWADVEGTPVADPIPRALAGRYEGSDGVPRHPDHEDHRELQLGHADRARGADAPHRLWRPGPALHTAPHR